MSETTLLWGICGLLAIILAVSVFVVVTRRSPKGWDRWLAALAVGLTWTLGLILPILLSGQLTEVWSELGYKISEGSTFDHFYSTFDYNRGVFLNLSLPVLVSAVLGGAMLYWMLNTVQSPPTNNVEG